MLSVAPNIKSPNSSCEEAVWNPIEGVWSQIFGSYRDLGISIEWHDLEPSQPVIWEKSFHSNSLELCLNLSGHGQLIEKKQTLPIGPSAAAFYRASPGKLRALRRAGENHRFATVEFAREYLAEILVGQAKCLHPIVADFLLDRSGGALGAVVPLRLGMADVVEALRSPPVSMEARAVWYRGKILELVSELFFVNDDAEQFFCTRQKRQALERVTKVRELIEQNLENPPSLKELSKSIGCSPFYLSRTFSEQAGMSLSKYIRRVRIERAAEILKTGKANVTEAAFAVGYSSLSHFSKSFHEVMGCCPGLYPLGQRVFQNPYQKSAQKSN